MAGMYEYTPTNNDTCTLNGMYDTEVDFREPSIVIDTHKDLKGLNDPHAHPAKSIDVEGKNGLPAGDLQTYLETIPTIEDDLYTYIDNKDAEIYQYVDQKDGEIYTYVDDADTTLYTYVDSRDNELLRKDAALTDLTNIAQAKVTLGIDNVDNISAADLRDRATHTGQQPLSTISDKGTAAYEDAGVANGVATLDSNAKVPLSQINDTILGQVSYQGQWNQNTNTPTLSTTPEAKGDYYICNGPTEEDIFGHTFHTGDWIISNGTSWDKIDNTDAVSSVQGRTGNVVITASDVDAYTKAESDAKYLTASDIPDIDSYTKTESDARYAYKSHTHAISDVTGLQTELDDKLDKSTPNQVMKANLYIQGNPSYIEFQDLAGNRTGYVGDGSTGNDTIYLESKTGALNFREYNSSAIGRPFHEGHLPDIDEVNGLQTALDSKAPFTGSIQNPIYLGTVNLNDLEATSDTSFYFQNQNVNTSSARNYPVNEAGTLIVTKAAGIVQTYITYTSPRIFTRSYYNNSWSAWQETYTSRMPPSWSNITSKPTSYTPSSHTHLGHDVKTLGNRVSIDSDGVIKLNAHSYRQAGMYGIYDSYKIGHVWSMGDGFRIDSNGADFGNLYGIAYKHTNNTTGGTMGGGHQMLWVTNGSPQVSLGDSGVWSAGWVNCTTLTTRTSSDKTLKENIKPLEFDKDKLKKLSLLTGNYNNKAGELAGEEFIGSVAQDVQEVFPHCVSVRDEEKDKHLNGTLTVDYPKLGWSLALAQNTVINEQEERIKKLEETVEKLLEKMEG